MQKSGNILVKTILILLVLSLGLTACKNPIETPTEGTPLTDTQGEPFQNETPEPEATATRDMRGVTQVVLGGDLPDDPIPTWTQSAILTQEALANKTPTATLPGIVFIGEQHYMVYQGGFSLTIVFDAHISVRSNLALIGSRSHPVNALVMGNVSKYEVVGVEDLPQQIFDSLFGSDAQVTQEDVEEFELDGVKGIAMNYISRIGQMVAKGRLVVVKPSEKRYVAIVGMGDPADPSGDQWMKDGVEFFNAILNSIEILDDEALVDFAVCPMSADETYGYSMDNPIRVGGEAFGGPARARAYLDNLQDSKGKWVAYERLGSMEHGGTILDAYVLTLDGKEVTLYVDQYSYEELLTPIGFNCGGAYPLIAP